MPTDYEVVFDGNAWERGMRALAADPTVALGGRLRRDPDRADHALLADDLRPLGGTVGGRDFPPLADWLLVAADRPGTMPADGDDWHRRLQPLCGQLAVVLVVRLNDPAGHWHGYVFEAGAVRRLGGFRVVGPGLLRVSAAADDDAVSPQWSRTFHAVGRRAFAALRRGGVAVVGASRLGSAVAQQLAAAGLRRLVLIDPDAVEPHNVVGMAGTTADDVGRNKAVVLAERLVRQFDDLAATALPLSLLDRRAVLRDVDLVVTAVDADAPRLAAARWAARHLAVHLDVGTGVTAADGRRLLAADVRLFLPRAGCVVCVGGLTDLAEAEYEVFAPRGALPRRPPESWNARGRLGSLATLNALAAASGVQAWLDLLNGELTTSVWQRLRWRAGSGLEVASAPVAAEPGCRVCQAGGRRAA